MFDPVTAALLRSAPSVPGIDATELPALLTQAFSELVAERLRSSTAGVMADGTRSRLAVMADTYELVAVLSSEPQTRRPAAFVAATAQQILAREAERGLAETPLLGRDYVAPSITAALLFLISEQYPDAHEAARSILFQRRALGISRVEQDLVQSLRNLVRGNLHAVLERALERTARAKIVELPVDGSALLFDALLDGVELLTCELLAVSHPAPGKFAGRTASRQFAHVLSLCSHRGEPHGQLSGRTLSTYPGPHHLGSLLLAAAGTLHDASISNIASPAGADAKFWRDWISHRAKSKPLLWPNHRQAIESGFHHEGVSAILTLPTGAGKTTVSEFKIAATLARGKSVVFLVPTHALADQLRDDLAEAFPSEITGGVVSTDFDLLLTTQTPLQHIEVMTPERCLALLSLDPAIFENVGLLVFDECHMLSGRAGSFRRALDSMLCLLNFLARKPDADLLLLSAMLEGPSAFAEWIEARTKRSCLVVDMVWKPSRQARGVLVYPESEVREAVWRANRIHRAKKTRTVSVAARNELRATPHVLFGLQHNWIEVGNATAICRISDSSVQLSGSVDETRKSVYPTPNVNSVSADLAIAAAERGLKTIVFVSTARQTISTARTIHKALSTVQPLSEKEEDLWDAVLAETGGNAHTLLHDEMRALPHSADLLPIERQFVEARYRSPRGPLVVVATTTLSQGMNLPAEFAILAGDKRADLSGNGREALEAHEILNAAGRAGRAGHLANGVVVLVPEAVLRFSDSSGPSQNALKRLASILPASDRCVAIVDPLQRVLDIIQHGVSSDDTEYLLNRMHECDGAGSRAADTFLKSYAAFRALASGQEAEFDAQVALFQQRLNDAGGPIDTTLMAATTQSGFSPSLLSAAMARLRELDEFPNTIEDWLRWLIGWFSDDSDAMLFLGPSHADVRKVLGRQSGAKITPHLDMLLEGLLAWISGRSLVDVERALGGVATAQCWRARELATNVAPRGVSFALAIVAQLARAVLSEQPDGEEVTLPVLDYMATAVRRGYNSKELLDFAGFRKDRARVHREFAFAKE